MRSFVTVYRARPIAAVLFLLWLSFLARGLWYCAIAPAWEGYDEPFHFAYLQHVAAGQGLPQATTPVSLEVENSLHLLPIPWELQFQRIPPPLTTYDDYWRMSTEERSRRETALRALPPDQGSQPANEPIANYEAQQAPLYYWLFALPGRWLAGLPLLSRLFALRMLNVLLASAVVPLSYLVSQAALGDKAVALSTTALLTLLPELMINVARVSNESLALLCFTLVLLFTLRAAAEPQRWMWWLLLGAALGCGLLTKAYFLTAIPALAIVALYCVWSNGFPGARSPGRRALAARICAALIVVFAIAGRRYLRVHAETGSWSGQGDDVALRGVSLAQKLAGVPHVNWKSGVVSVLLSHTWFGGWSFLRLPLVLYLASLAAIILAVAGVVTRLVRRQSQNPEELRGISILGSFYVCFWGGLAYHVLITYLNQGVSASEGWYLYSLVAAEVVLLVWGLQAFLRADVVLTGLSVGAALVDLYGVQSLLLPYYTGLTAHVGKTVAPALLRTLYSLPLVFARLAGNKPEWLGAPVLVTMWCLYLIATVASVMVAGPALFFQRGPRLPARI